MKFYLVAIAAVFVFVFFVYKSLDNAVTIDHLTSQIAYKEQVNKEVISMLCRIAEGRPMQEIKALVGAAVEPDLLKVHPEKMEAGSVVFEFKDDKCIDVYEMGSTVDADTPRQHLRELFDTNAHLGKAVFRYDSERSFHGDGYSIAVYQLPASIRARFESADEKLLSEFPKYPSYRDHWKIEHWRRSPFDERFNRYLDFALSSYDAGNVPELTKYFDAIRMALKEEGAFYAFFYHGVSPHHVANVDFFIVDLKEGRLYLINHNT